MDIGIIGSGIAGLTLANLLQDTQNLGFKVTIYDQAKVLKPVGAGFTLQPNGLSIMKKIGVYDEIIKRSAKVDNSVIYDTYGNKLPTDIMRTLSSDRESYSIHRGDFQEILLKNLSQFVNIQLNHEFISARNIDDKVEITFGNGRTWTHDLLIGADGVRSQVRRVISPETKLEAERVTAIRALIPKCEATTGGSNFRAWMGGNKVLVTYPVKDSQKINIAAYVPSNNKQYKGWSQAVSKHTLLEEFKGWGFEAINLMNHVEYAFSWELYDHLPLSSWSEGAICVIGDAAHSMLPYLGQGANQAIEDCGVLASLLTDITSKNEIEGVLKDYESIRKESVTVIQSLSRQAGHVFRDDFGGDIGKKAKEINKLLDQRS